MLRFPAVPGPFVIAPSVTSKKSFYSQILLASLHTLQDFDDTSVTVNNLHTSCGTRQMVVCYILHDMMAILWC